MRTGSGEVAGPHDVRCRGGGARINRFSDEKNKIPPKWKGTRAGFIQYSESMQRFVDAKILGCGDMLYDLSRSKESISKGHFDAYNIVGTDYA